MSETTHTPPHTPSQADGLFLWRRNLVASAVLSLGLQTGPPPVGDRAHCTDGAERFVSPWRSAAVAALDLDHDALGALAHRETTAWAAKRRSTLVRARIGARTVADERASIRYDAHVFRDDSPGAMPRDLVRPCERDIKRSVPVAAMAYAGQRGGRSRRRDGAPSGALDLSGLSDDELWLAAYDAFSHRGRAGGLSPRDQAIALEVEARCYSARELARRGGLFDHGMFAADILGDAGRSLGARTYAGAMAVARHQGFAGLVGSGLELATVLGVSERTHWRVVGALESEAAWVVVPLRRNATPAELEAGLPRVLKSRNAYLPAPRWVDFEPLLDRQHPDHGRHYAQACQRRRSRRAMATSRARHNKRRAKARAAGEPEPDWISPPSADALVDALADSAELKQALGTIADEHWAIRDGEVARQARAGVAGEPVDMAAIRGAHDEAQAALVPYWSRLAVGCETPTDAELAALALRNSGQSLTDVDIGRAVLESLRAEAPQVPAEPTELAKSWWTDGAKALAQGASKHHQGGPICEDDWAHPWSATPVGRCPAIDDEPPKGMTSRHTVPSPLEFNHTDKVGNSSAPGCARAGPGDANIGPPATAPPDDPPCDRRGVRNSRDVDHDIPGLDRRPRDAADSAGATVLDPVSVMASLVVRYEAAGRDTTFLREALARARGRPPT